MVASGRAASPLRRGRSGCTTSLFAAVVPAPVRVPLDGARVSELGGDDVEPSGAGRLRCSSSSDRRRSVAPASSRAGSPASRDVLDPADAELRHVDGLARLGGQLLGHDLAHVSSTGIPSAGCPSSSSRCAPSTHRGCRSCSRPCTGTRSGGSSRRRSCSRRGRRPSGRSDRGGRARRAVRERAIERLVLRPA